MTVSTTHLELIAGTKETARAEIDDRDRLAELLHALVPDSWPPPLNDTDSMQWFARYLEENPDGVGWTLWYIILRDSLRGERVLIGVIGFKGKPLPDGTIETGYSILEEFQCAGYATEALQALLAWAFAHMQVRRVIAETYPELIPSIRVLEKNRFVNIGRGSEEDIIRFEISRQAFENR